MSQWHFGQMKKKHQWSLFCYTLVKIQGGRQNTPISKMPHIAWSINISIHIKEYYMLLTWITNGIPDFETIEWWTTELSPFKILYYATPVFPCTILSPQPPPPDGVVCCQGAVGCKNGTTEVYPYRQRSAVHFLTSWDQLGRICCERYSRFNTWYIELKWPR